MTSEFELTLPALFARSAEIHRDSNALSYVGEKAVSYGELKYRIASLSAHMERIGVRPGDRIAILGSNMPNWGICYLATVFMGAVAVPLLPDFHPREIGNILTHSESKLIFVSEGLRSKLEGLETEDRISVIGMEDFSPVDPSSSIPAYEHGRIPEIHHVAEENDLAAIIYTSGTSGSSKGVMLSHRNICSNVLACRQLHMVTKEDRFLSLLPLSHTLENTIGFLVPLMNGACVNYLKKPPSPSVLLAAMAEVHPTIMLSVPMVIEKIYFQKIMPAMYGKWILRSLMRAPFLKRFMHRAAGRKLMDSFGGKLEFFGIGGARLNSRVEQFLIDARFPYAVGYGLTETSPLLAGAVVGKTRLGSTGPAIEGVELKIHKPDPRTGEGEIWARGPNVMMGYYREPGLTSEVLDREGWLRTGDLGCFDREGNLFIRGRLKNMIVGASGENIYPEEIEFVINNFKHVVESLVIEKKGKLVALVHFNLEEIEQATQHLREELNSFMEKKLDELLQEIKEYVNSRVNKFSQVQSFVVQTAPFQKTATQKIKRYLYH